MGNMARGYTVKQTFEMLKKFVSTRTTRAAAAELGVSQQFLCDVLAGRRPVGPTIAKHFGLEAGFIKSERAA